MLAHAAPQDEPAPVLTSLESIRLEQMLLPERLRMYCYTERQIKDPKYRNLKQVQLTVDERNWLCEEVDRKHDARYDMCVTKNGLVRRYSLYKNFFSKNWKSYLKYGVTKPIGVPPLGSLPDERRRWGTLLTKRRNELDELTYPELTNELTALKRTRRLENNIFTPADKLDTKVDPRTTTSFVKRFGLELGNKQAVDNSRVTACMCPLMSYVWYIICLAISGFLAPCCKWNADACTFVFHAKETKGVNNKTVRLMHDSEIEFLEDGDVRLKETQKGKSKSASSQLPYAIKVTNIYFNYLGIIKLTCILVLVK